MNIENCFIIYISVDRQANRGSLKARQAKVPLIAQARRSAGGVSSAISSSPAVFHGSLTNLLQSKRGSSAALQLQSERSDLTAALSTGRTEDTDTSASAGDALTATATELQASERSATTCPTNCRSLGALIVERSRATAPAERPSRLSELNAALERDLADLARSVHVPSNATPAQSARPATTSTSASASASSAAASSQRSLPVAQLAPALTTDNVDVLRTICTAAARLKRSSDALLVRPARADTQTSRVADEPPLDLVTAMLDLRLVECNLSELERVSSQRSSARPPTGSTPRDASATDRRVSAVESAHTTSTRSASPDSSDSSTY